MEKEKVDPVYKYVDGQIKLIKRELQQFKVAHDTLVAQQAQSLLHIQRRLATFMIISTVNTCASRVDIEHDIFNELNISAGTALARVETSDDPLLIAHQFYSTCLDKLEKSGIKVVHYG